MKDKPKKTELLLGECADEDLKKCEETQIRLLKGMVGGKNVRNTKSI